MQLRGRNRFPSSPDLLVVKGRLRTTDRPQLLIFATNTMLSPRRALQLYWHRWGIETGFRQIHSLRAMTTSPDFRYRALLFGVACLLLAFWVWLNLLLWRNEDNFSRRTPGEPIWISQRKFHIAMSVYELRQRLLKHLGIVWLQGGDL